MTNATTATCTTPEGTAGTKNVEVTTPGGTGIKSESYTYVEVPTVTAVSPSVGPLAGGTSITITGENLTGATAIKVGGTECSAFSVTNATTATCTTPEGTAGTKNVEVTTPGGTTVANTLYTYYAIPEVTAVSPNSGSSAGGTSITITGENLIGATAIKVGGNACESFNVSNDTTATCTTPPGTAGANSVEVTTPGGITAANTLYTYTTVPTVTGITPNTGTTAGGTPVTISGNDFTGATAVTVGGVACGNYTVVSATSITCTTGAHAPGAVSVEVTTPEGTSEANTLYTYALSPTIFAVSPSSGSQDGGTPVIITGSNMTGASQVLFDKTPATGVTVNPAGNQITAVSPPHAGGAVDVSVVTPAGEDVLELSFTYDAPPAVPGTPIPAPGDREVNVS